MDTIAALSTPIGIGALGVVRISGPAVEEFILAVCKEGESVLNLERQQVYTAVYNTPQNNPKNDKDLIDYALCTFFKGPKSYTGEDLLEVSLHGSPLVIKKFLRCTSNYGIRKADPGEFTRRAFLNGKLDLVQAEAVHDLIISETDSQLKAAQNQLSGKLSGSVLKLGEPLRDLLAEIEAHIDFPEEDINPEKSDAWLRVINEVINELNKYIASFESGKLIKDGVLVPLVGIPNAGKSSLLNALLKEERAIVTDIPGTTRDYIEEKISIDEILIRLVDTAGLAEQISEGRTIDAVELIGIKRSQEFITKADLIIFLIDPIEDLKKQLEILADIKSKNLLVVINKADLLSEEKKTTLGKSLENFQVVFISTLSSLGLNELKDEISNLIGLKQISNQTLITSERQRDCLSIASKNLYKAIESINSLNTEEYISFELRTALTNLNEIVGVTNTEDILGRIFSKFCIGK